MDISVNLLIGLVICINFITVPIASALLMSINGFELSKTARKWHQYENFMSTMFKLSDKIKVTLDQGRTRVSDVSPCLRFSNMAVSKLVSVTRTPCPKP